LQTRNVSICPKFEKKSFEVKEKKFFLTRQGNSHQGLFYEITTNNLRTIFHIDFRNLSNSDYLILQLSTYQFLSQVQGMINLVAGPEQFFILVWWDLSPAPSKKSPLKAAMSNSIFPFATIVANKYGHSPHSSLFK